MRYKKELFSDGYISEVYFENNVYFIQEINPNCFTCFDCAEGRYLTAKRNGSKRSIFSATMEFDQLPKFVQSHILLKSLP